jgi:hypothetical protein
MTTLWKKITGVLSMIVILSLPDISLAGGPVAERPHYSPGDYWVFVNKTRPKELRHTYLQEEEGKYVFTLNGSDRTTHFYFTSDIKRAPKGYPGAIIAFPLHVGKKWDYRFERRENIGGPQTKAILAEHRVEDYEKVTVPAGTFDAYKITVYIEAVQTRKMLTMPEKMYFWYSPVAKQLIKRINRKKVTWELKEYDIK